MDLDIESIFEEWQRELVRVDRDPDPAVIAQLELTAAASGVRLEDVQWHMEHEMLLAGITAAVWDPDLHPRGKDGKFIEVGGLIKLLDFVIQTKSGKTINLKNRRGRVTSIVPDDKSPGNPKIMVMLEGPDGKPAMAVTVKPKDIVAAPDKARLTPGKDATPDVLVNGPTNGMERINGKGYINRGNFNLPDYVTPDGKPVRFDYERGPDTEPVPMSLAVEDDYSYATIGQRSSFGTDGITDAEEWSQVSVSVNGGTEEDRKAALDAWVKDQFTLVDEGDAVGSDLPSGSFDNGEVADTDWGTRTTYSATAPDIDLGGDSADVAYGENARFAPGNEPLPKDFADDPVVKQAAKDFNNDPYAMAAMIQEEYPGVTSAQIAEALGGDTTPEAPEVDDTFAMMTNNELGDLMAQSIERGMARDEIAFRDRLTAEMQIRNAQGIKGPNARRDGGVPSAPAPGDAAIQSRERKAFSIAPDDASMGTDGTVTHTALPGVQFKKDGDGWTRVDANNGTTGPVTDEYLADELDQVKGKADFDWSQTINNIVAYDEDTGSFVWKDGSGPLSQDEAEELDLDTRFPPDGMDTVAGEAAARSLIENAGFSQDGVTQNPAGGFRMQRGDDEIIKMPDGKYRATTWTDVEVMGDTIKEPKTLGDFNTPEEALAAFDAPAGAEWTAPASVSEWDDTTERWLDDVNIERIKSGSSQLTRDEFQREFIDKGRKPPARILAGEKTKPVSLSGDDADKATRAKLMELGIDLDTIASDSLDAFLKDARDTLADDSVADKDESLLDLADAYSQETADYTEDLMTPEVSDALTTVETSYGTGVTLSEAGSYEMMTLEETLVEPSWMGGTNKSQRNGIRQFLDDYRDDISNNDIDLYDDELGEDLSGYGIRLDDDRDLIYDIIDKAEALGMAPSDYMDTVEQLDDLGSAQLEQLRNVMNGQPLDDQNPNALRNIRNVLESNEIGAGGVAYENLYSGIDDYLNGRMPGGNENAPGAPGNASPDADIDEAVSRWQDTGSPVDGTDAANLMIGRGKERGDSDAKIRSDIGDVFGDDVAGLDIDDRFKWTSPQSDASPDTAAVDAARSKAKPETLGTNKVEVFAPGEGSSMSADKWQTWTVNDDGSRNGGREHFDTEAEARAYADEKNRLTALYTGEVNRDLTDDQLQARIDELVEDLDLAPDEKHLPDGSDIPDQGRREAWIELNGAYTERRRRFAESTMLKNARTTGAKAYQDEMDGKVPRQLTRKKGESDASWDARRAEWLAGYKEAQAADTPSDAPEPEPQAAPDAQVTGPDAGFEGSEVKLLDGADATPGSTVVSVKDGKLYTIVGVYNSAKLKENTYIAVRDQDGKLSYKSKRTMKAGGVAPELLPEAETPTEAPTPTTFNAPGSGNGKTLPGTSTKRVKIMDDEIIDAIGYNSGIFRSSHWGGALTIQHGSSSGEQTNGVTKWFETVDGKKIETTAWKIEALNGSWPKSDQLPVMQNFWRTRRQSMSDLVEAYYDAKIGKKDGNMFNPGGTGKYRNSRFNLVSRPDGGWSVFNYDNGEGVGIIDADGNWELNPNPVAPA